MYPHLEDIQHIPLFVFDAQAMWMHVYIAMYPHFKDTLIKYVLAKCGYTVQSRVFFTSPLTPAERGLRLKGLVHRGNPRLGGGGLRQIRGVSAVGFTDNNRPSGLTCIYFSWSPPRVRGGIRKVGGAYELGIFHLHVHIPV